MKKNYITPSANFITLDNRDLIATSFGDNSPRLRGDIDSDESQENL